MPTTKSCSSRTTALYRKNSPDLINGGSVTRSTSDRFTKHAENYSIGHVYKSSMSKLPCKHHSLHPRPCEGETEVHASSTSVHALRVSCTHSYPQTSARQEFTWTHHHQLPLNKAKEEHKASCSSYHDSILDYDASMRSSIQPAPSPSAK